MALKTLVFVHTNVLSVLDALMIFLRMCARIAAVDLHRGPKDRIQLGVTAFQLNTSLCQLRDVVSIIQKKISLGRQLSLKTSTPKIVEYKVICTHTKPE